MQQHQQHKIPVPVPDLSDGMPAHLISQVEEVVGIVIVSPLPTTLQDTSASKCMYVEGHQKLQLAGAHAGRSYTPNATYICAHAAEPSPLPNRPTAYIPSIPHS